MAANPLTVSFLLLQPHLLLAPLSSTLPTPVIQLQEITTSSPNSSCGFRPPCWHPCLLPFGCPDSLPAAWKTPTSLLRVGSASLPRLQCLPDPSSGRRRQYFSYLPPSMPLSKGLLTAILTLHYHSLPTDPSPPTPVTLHTTWYLTHNRPQ